MPISWIKQQLEQADLGDKRRKKMSMAIREKWAYFF